ncbi:MAG: beta-glucosidase/6-phospho-beta-glucosidase/beta-galactosidase, partial [Sphingobacteriales bacterium]
EKNKIEDDDCIAYLNDHLYQVCEAL